MEGEKIHKTCSTTFFTSVLISSLGWEEEEAKEVMSLT